MSCDKLTDEWMEQASRMLTHDEGRKESPYRDSLGFWTIGVGHLLGEDLFKMKFPDHLIDFMLRTDIEEAWSAVCDIFTQKEVESWPPARQLALLNLSFNLGRTKLKQFVRTIGAIKEGRWSDAAGHLRQSLWAKQVKSRSERVCYMVETGELHEAYLVRG